MDDEKILSRIIRVKVPRPSARLSFAEHFALLREQTDKWMCDWEAMMEEIFGSKENASFKLASCRLGEKNVHLEYIVLSPTGTGGVSRGYY